MEKIQQRKIEIEDMKFIKELFGNFDENVKFINRKLKIDITSREGEIILTGEDGYVDLGEKLIGELQNMSKKGETLTPQKINYIISILLEGKEDEIKDLIGNAILVTAKGKPIKPKTLGQKYYIEEIISKDLTFGIGPAGTGKTYLAVAMAVKAFRNEEVNKIILTRPAVEAGENLGFLPGDLKDKVDPYLRPLYDGLFDILGVDKFQKYMERGLIEVAPLAYMRGRTLENSFIILDEAQNTTKEQMKMFLTRIGFGSKVVVTGDITQIDLPGGKYSGLKHTLSVLKDIREIGFCYLTDKDVVRHSLVQKIIKAYEIADNKSENPKESK